MAYDEYVEYLNKCIKDSKDLEFLKKHQTNIDVFKHSGFACRKGVIPKQLDTNSIIKPDIKMGFGASSNTISHSQPLIRQVYSSAGNIQALVRENPKMEARKLGELCVQQVCREYGRQNIMAFGGTQLSNNDLDVTNSKQSGLADFNRMLSRQGSMASAAASQGVSRPTTGVANDKSPIKPRFHEPTVSATISTDQQKIVRPSSSAPAFKRLQQARKGHHPFEFEMPHHTITEMRCILHPSMKRDWNYPEDTWFPGMMTKNKELREKNREGVFNERKIEAKKYFQTKLYQYNEADVEEARSKPIVRCASAYIDQDRAVRQAQNEKDKNIICKKTVYDKVLKKERVVNVPFYTLFKGKQVGQEEKKIADDDKTDCTSAREYRPVSSHKFREMEKTKWVSKKNFKLF